jgi:hypothetical protein
MGASAQTRATSGDLTGVVYDQSKGVLPGAVVTATNVETNLARSAVTDGEGRYTVPALPPGTYSIRCEMAGFVNEVAADVALTLGATVNLTFTLRVLGTSEQVSVTAQVPVVDVRATAVASVVSQKQIDSLPINGRNFISFSIITPGVSVDQTPQQGASATSGLTFAGQRARSNNITVDGLDNNDATLGSVRATFSQEAVREFQVLTNSYSAEFGKASGGVVNIVTKSGANTATGNAFFYLRDQSLNAAGHFERFSPAGADISQPKAPYNQKQFGATLGGPFKRDKTFYFASFERLDVAASNFVTIDDSTLVSLFGQPLGLTPAGILRRAGFEVLTGNVPYDVGTNALLAKVDQQMGSSQSLVVRYTYGDGLNQNIEPFGGQIGRSRGAELNYTDNMMAASHTAVLSSQWVNEVRTQFARRDQSINSLDPRCGGPCLTEDQGGPTIEVTGVASLGRQRFTPQPRLNDRYQVLDTLSLFVGRHQFKTGFDYNYINHSKQSLPLHFGGRYIFAPIPAANAAALGLAGPVTSIQAVYLGIPARYVQGYGDASTLYKYSDLSLFVQDDWRISSQLTLRAGLRYQNQYWPDFPYNVAGFGTYTFPKDGNNLAPRIALAFVPNADARTSIHASYGIFFDNHITSIAGITREINGEDKVQTLVVGPPTSITAWNQPTRRLPRAAVPAVFPSLEISIDPGLETPYAQHVSAGIDRELPGAIGLSANLVHVRGFKQLGTIDYNPTVASLGAGRRPEDVGGVPLSSAPILQYTSWGETWYTGLMLSASKRFNERYQMLASYTLSKAEDTSTDYQSAFVPQNNGQGRSRADLTGLPVGFNPDDERGPSTQDQRHRLVLSSVYLAPKRIQIATIVTVASGRPYNILAGLDLNADGDGGAFPSDRARRDPATEVSSVGRNAGTMPAQAGVDLRVSRQFPIGRMKLEGIFEVFNLFNRTNYTDINNIFGAGAYPGAGLPEFGQFTQAGAPLQAQVAAKIIF